MRIAFITFEYPPFIIGGAGVYAWNITHELAKLGHEVVVFTPKIDNSEDEKYDTDYLKVRRIKINKNFPFKALQFWLRLPKSVKKLEKEEGFDIIHFNSISYWFLRKRISRAPQVITIHHLVKDAITRNNLSFISRMQDISGENSILIPLIEERCIKSVDRIIAVSNFTKRRIIETYGIKSDRIKVIYNGIDSTGYNFTRDELEEVKKQFNLTKRAILFVGRVDDPRKGLDLLLKAFKRVLEKIDATLLVIGKGDQTKARKLAKDLNVSENIVFEGFVDELTLKKNYALCDLYVCPSRLEGFGLTVLEALVAGKPIIATNVGAVPEIIGDCGVLVNSEDVEALSKAIIELLNNNKGRKYLKKSSRRITEFTWDKSAKMLIDDYMEIIKI